MIQLEIISIRIKYRGQLSLAECAGSGGSENRVISPSACASSAAENGKLDIFSSVLNRSWSSDLLLFVEHCSLDDRDGVRWSPVVTSHLSVELTNGTVKGNISVLLVHVVVSSSGLISQNNSESFYMVGSSLENFVHWQNLTLCALGLELVAQMVPEFRFSDNFVTSEKSNGKDFWVGFLFSGKFAS